VVQSFVVVVAVAADCPIPLNDCFECVTLNECDVDAPIHRRLFFS
jgi:hypothetical protein